MRVERGFLSPLTAPFSSEEGLFSTTPRIFNRSFGGDEAVTACRFRRGLFETIFLERARAAEGAERESDPNERAGTRSGVRLPDSEVLFACGGAAAFDRSLWLALGGLDPLFAPFYWEDVDLSWRARKRGWRILHVPESVVHHEHSATIGARFDRRQVIDIYERNRLLFQWKNLTSPRLTASHLAWLPFRLVRAAATRPEFLRGFTMALPRIGEARRARRFERTIEKLTDEAILAKFGVARRRR
jgi:GT2 family glycosyltransferase